MFTTRYVTTGCDAEFTTHVVRLHQDPERCKIIATFNSWWRATKYANALTYAEAHKAEG